MKGAKLILGALFVLLMLSFNAAACYITIYKFNDSNGNGIKDCNENYLANFTFTVVGKNFSYSKTVTTDSNGKIYLNVSGSIPDRDYIVTEIPKAGWISTTANPQTAQIKDWEDDTLYFGNKKIPTTTTTTTTSTTTTSTTTTTSSTTTRPTTTTTCPTTTTSTTRPTTTTTCPTTTTSTTHPTTTTSSTTTTTCPTTSTTTTSTSTTTTLPQCVTEGNYAVVVPGVPTCCDGLIPITPRMPSDEACTNPVGAMICTKCGNGVCGIGENYCNCPVDCPTTTTTTTRPTTTTSTTSTSTTTTPPTTTTSTTTTTSSTTTTTMPVCGSGIVIRAKGDAAKGVGPTMYLRIDGKNKVAWTNVSSSVMDYRYDIDLCTGNHTIDIVYTNDCQVNGTDRNLYLYFLQVGGIIKYPTESGVIYDRGSGEGAFDGVDAVSGRTLMDINGAMRFSMSNGRINDIFSTTTTTTTTSTTTTRSTTTTTIPLVCALIGDTIPCGKITLSEVVDLINKWGKGQTSLANVVRLIDAWTAN